jgi:hypothetical protein
VRPNPAFAPQRDPAAPASTLQEAAWQPGGVFGQPKEETLEQARRGHPPGPVYPHSPCLNIPYASKRYGVPSVSIGQQRRVPTYHGV